MNKRIITIIGMVIIAAGLAYFASAAGVILFGGDSHHETSDGLLLDLSLAADNYTSGTKTFTDNSGSGKNGVSTNVVAFVPDNYGKSAGAMSFNGTDMVEIPIANFNYPGITFAFWIKTGSNSIVFNSYINTPRVAVNITGGKAQFNIRGSNGVTVPDLYVTSLSSVTDNNWHYVVAEKDNDNIKIYVDGTLEATTSGASNLDPSTYRTTFGLGASGIYHDVGFTPSFVGNLDEFRIYNRALSASEVKQLYNYSSKPKVAASSIQKGLVGYWPLDGDNYNATTGRVTDKTPYGNHGSNSGATLTTGRNDQSNGAMSFNGSNSYISMGDPASGLFDFGTGDFALSAWVKISALPNNWKSIIYKGGSGGAGYGMEISSSNNLTCSIQGASGSNQHYQPVGVIVGEWQHFVCVFDRDDKIYGYLNGALIGSGGAYDSGNNTSVSTGNSFVIGSFGPGQWYLSGSITDVRAYNRALSASEVSSLYTQGGRSVGIIISPAVRDSCKEILDAGESHGDGFYTIKPNPTGYSFPVYCDMTTDGGGWTLIDSHLVDSISNQSASVVTTYDSNGGVIVTSTATSPGCGAPPSSGSTIKIKIDIAWTQIRSIGEIYDNASCFSFNGNESYGGQSGQGNLIPFNSSTDVMRNCYLTCEQLQFSNFTSRCDNDAGNFMRFNPGQWRRFETILRRNNPSVLSGISAGVSCNGLTTKWRSSSIYVK